MLELLQWGHSFQLGNPEEKMKQINMTGRFNGATLFSLEIPAGLRVSGGSRRLQWVHVFSDVEINSASPRRPCGSRFNGATSFQTWKSGNILHIVVLPVGFNGATSFQTWKYHTVRPSSLAVCSFNGATSFQTWKLSDLDQGKLSASRFNGATSFQTWK